MNYYACLCLHVELRSTPAVARDYNRSNIHFLGETNLPLYLVNMTVLHVSLFTNQRHHPFSVGTYIQSSISNAALTAAFSMFKHNTYPKGTKTILNLPFVALSNIL